MTDENLKNHIFRELFELGLAFLIAFIAYQGLILITGSSVPVVSVASGSMLPKLYPGDLVFSMQANDLTIGDIIIYKAECAYMPPKDIIHRIIGFESGKIITKGDNNEYADPCPVNYSQVRGRVLFGVPLLGWPRLWLNYITGS